MPSIGVYVPDSMAEKAKEFGIAVSAICQRAIEQEINRMTAIQEITDTDLKEAAERILETARDEHETDRLTGLELGAQWTKVAGTHRQIRHVIAASFWEDLTYHYDEEQGYRYPEYIVEWLLGLDFDRDLLHSEAFAEGFIEGVETVYTEMEPLLTNPTL